MLRFAHNTALVTGATSGIGKSMAHALAAEGAALCLVGRNREALEEVARSARSAGVAVMTYAADFLVDGELRELSARLRNDLPSLDLLLHSAGAIGIGPIESAPVEELDRQYFVNVRAPYCLTQVILPALRRRQGQVVFFNSLVGLTAKGGSSQYSATKHALKAIADSLRQEVNGDGIRVLSVFLGRAATPMQAGVHEMERRTYLPERLVQPDDVAGAVLNALCLPRSAEVTDITIRHAIRVD